MNSGYRIPCVCGAWARNRQRGGTVSHISGQAVPPSIWDCPKCGYSSETPPTPGGPAFMAPVVPTVFDRLTQDDDIG